jgi:hypothetical protein
VLELADLPEPSAPRAGRVLIGVEHRTSRDRPQQAAIDKLLTLALEHGG